MARTQQNKKTDYLNQVFGSEDLLLKDISQAIKKEGVERMQISAYEARILQFLVQISQAREVVEIGTLYAYSTWHLASALPEGGRVWTLDISSERHQKAQEILKDSPDFKKIQWVTGKALDTLKSIETEAPFDMIFIDADKEAYLDYLDWGEKHLKTGGLLTADNTFLFGAVYGESDRSPQPKTIEIMKKFNERLSNSSYWKGALIPTDEGLTVSIKQ